jgi:hypothetical protein
MASPLHGARGVRWWPLILLTSAACAVPTPIRRTAFVPVDVFGLVAAQSAFTNVGFENDLGRLGDYTITRIFVFTPAAGISGQAGPVGQARAERARSG